jgi:putative endonuclease
MGVGMSRSPQPTYWVYFMTNRSGTLYIGKTNNLERRIWEHHHGVVAGFTSKYRITKLVLAEPFSEVRDAIAREKQLKKWSREKKLALIRASNPDWNDLADEWFGRAP